MTWKDELGRRRRALTASLIQGAWYRMQNAGMVTAESAAGRRFAAFGPGSLMAFPTGAVYGEHWIEVGDKTMIAELVTMCAGMAPGLDLGPEPVLRVGNGCVIGRGSHIVAHHSIEIGDDVFTGPYVYITDQNHKYEDISLPIGRQWPVNSAVKIGAGSWLGTGAVILPGADIGRNVVVAAGSVVRGAVPDNCVVAGVPAKVVRQHVEGVGWARPNGHDGGSRGIVPPGQHSSAVPAQGGLAGPSQS
jgi:acetyltransferase-like isoleucine patch superfamily enzyme